MDNDSQEISIHSIDYKSVDLPNTIQSLGYYFNLISGDDESWDRDAFETARYRDNHKCRLPVRCKQSAIRTVYVVL